MEQKRRGKFIDFVHKKGVTLSPKEYLITAMNALAMGLFPSLLIGTIFATLGDRLGIPFFLQAAEFAKTATGPVLGVAIAYSLGAPTLVMLSAAAVGFAGNALGDNVGVYLAALVATELGKLVSKETSMDILVTPAVTILSGVAVAVLLGPAVAALMTALGDLIMYATELRPVLMGAIVSVIVGLALTLPISSAALCIMLGLSGVAAGAATAGCCAHMVGYAVMSFRENRWSGLVAQGLGSSALQMGNIMKNPLTLIPPTLASVVTGPLASALFKLENIPAAAGMGTCGLVGPLGMLTVMEPSARFFTGLALICFVLPALFTLLFAWPMRKLGWIRSEDLKLEL